MAVTAVIIALFQLVLLCIINPKLKEAVDMENIEKSKEYSLQMEAVTSIASIKMATIEEDVFYNWRKAYDNSIKRFIQRVKYINYESIAMSSIQMFGPSIILIIGIASYINNGISLGKVIAFQTLSSMFLSSVTSVFNCQYVCSEN